VRSAEHSQRFVDMPIFTLNFTKDVMEARYHNHTQIFPVQLARHNGAGALWNMYSENTATATGFVYNTLYGKRIIDAESPCGANCTFEQTFQGPAYKCDDVDFSDTDDVNNPFCSFTSTGEFGDCGAVFQDSRSDGSLNGITWYSARDSLEAAPDCSPDEDISCPPPRADWQDGKLWVAYQYLLPAYRGRFDDFGRLLDPEAEVPTDAFDRRMFVCQSYNATYTIRRWYQDFQQTVTGNITQVHPHKFTQGTQKTNSNPRIATSTQRISPPCKSTPPPPKPTAPTQSTKSSTLSCPAPSSPALGQGPSTPPASRPRPSSRRCPSPRAIRPPSCPRRVRSPSRT
jgi:hypothetical protein